MRYDGQAAFELGMMIAEIANTGRSKHPMSEYPATVKPFVVHRNASHGGADAGGAMKSESKSEHAPVVP